MNDEQLLRYSRHILLDDIGITGQQRIVNAKVRSSAPATGLAGCTLSRVRRRRPVTLAGGDT
jgi:molybdopterin/thiamine biosynthesis adenylyltransferase